MGRWLAVSATIAALATAGLAADQLPKSDDDDASFEVEPPLLIPYRGPEAGAVSVTTANPAPNVDLARLEQDLERARRRAQNAEHLFKIGVLAKVEAEQRALRVVRLQADLENARLAVVKEEFALREKSRAAGGISKEDFKETENALARAISAAHAAVAGRERAELQAAEANVRRQQQLLSLGSGRKSEVARAEQKLAELKAQKN
jgi:hypothetical protein